MVGSGGEEEDNPLGEEEQPGPADLSRVPEKCVDVLVKMQSNMAPFCLPAPPNDTREED